MNKLEKIAQEASRIIKCGKGSHDWEHTERVLALALSLAKKEGADVEIISAAALLHDIARYQEDQTSGRIDHAFRGAELAEAILKKHHWNKEHIKAISHCIKTHRFRNKCKPKTLEAKVLFDADKLDSIGAVGIGRAFLFAGEVGARLHHPDIEIKKTLPYTVEDTAYREYWIKLRKIKNRIITSAGRELARKRHKFMTAFFRRLNQEVKGRY